jgi:hypothetical protein
MTFKNWIHNTNLRVARSPVGKWFRLEGSGHVRISMILCPILFTLYPAWRVMSEAEACVRWELTP